MTIAPVALGQTIDPTTFGNPVVDQLNTLDDLEAAWIPYTATLTNITPGTTGLVRSDRYLRFGTDGKTLIVWNAITLGTGGAVTGWPLFSPPLGLSIAASQRLMGQANITIGPNNYPCLPYSNTGTTIGPVALNVTGSYLVLSFPGVGVPAAWVAGASMNQCYLMEVA